MKIKNMIKIASKQSKKYKQTSIFFIPGRKYTEHLTLQENVRLRNE